MVNGCDPTSVKRHFAKQNSSWHLSRDKKLDISEDENEKLKVQTNQQNFLYKQKQGKQYNIEDKLIVRAF